MKLFADRFRLLHLNAKRSIAAAFVASTVIMMYLPALQNGFVNWDDEFYVLDNLHIRSLDVKFFRWAFFDFHVANWHPLTWLSHALDYAFWGMNPSGHHLTSVVLHGLNTLLVVLLILKLLDIAKNVAMSSRRIEGFPSDRGILAAAVITGLLFGLHPLHVESVAWVSERKDVLYAFFFLLSILAYIRYVKDAREDSSAPMLLGRSYLTCLGLFFLSLLSKPMAVTLPAVLLILDWYPLRRFPVTGKLKTVLIEKLPFFALSLGSIILTLKAQSSGYTIISLKSVPLSVRIMVGFKSLITYLEKMIWPTRLIPFYRHPQKASLLSFEYMLPVLLVIGITVACIAISRRQRVWSSIWAYYVVTLLPVLGFIQVGGQAMADRYTYLPSLAPFLSAGLCVALILDKLIASKRRHLIEKAIYTIIVLIIGVLSYTAIKQTHIWKDSITLWSHEIEIEPGYPEPYHHRGNAYRVLGHYEKALKDFTEAIRLDPISDSNYYNDRGIVYVKFRRFQEALNDFNLAIIMSPSNPVFYRNRGNAYMELGRSEDAQKDFMQANNIENNPFYDKEPSSIIKP